MERLTEKDEYISESTLKAGFKYKANLMGALAEQDKRKNACYVWHSAIDKLAKYENTGLTPEQIVEMRNEIKENTERLKIAEEIVKAWETKKKQLILRDKMLDLIANDLNSPFSIYSQCEECKQKWLNFWYEKAKKELEDGKNK